MPFRKPDEGANVEVLSEVHRTWSGAYQLQKPYIALYPPYPRSPSSLITTNDTHSTMELFMHNVDWNIDRHVVTRQFANLLHGPNFTDLSSIPINFHVQLHPDKKHVRGHGGTGALTLPTIDIGKRLLDLYQSQPLTIGRKTISLSNSKRSPRPDVVESIRLQPYIDPASLAQRERRAAQLNAGRISIETIQFGWECRDYVFSIECEHNCAGKADLLFNDERRELRVKLRYQDETYFIAMNYSHITSITMNKYLEIEHAMVII